MLFVTVLYTDVDTLSQLQVNICIPSDVDAILPMKLHQSHFKTNNKMCNLQD